MPRFWSKVDVGGPDECWLWRAATNQNGYGVFHDDDNHGHPAHRVAWILTKGDPGDKFACHICDNPPCCNPGHLFLGTAKANSDDMWAKGRARRALGEKHGSSKLTAEDARQIRVARRLGISGRWLALLFGVKETTISAIHSGATWRHVDV